MEARGTRRPGGGLPRCIPRCPRAIPRTKSDVNSVVTAYDLAWQAKDGLKNHLPDLDDSDDPKWKQPVRYTSRAAKFDRDAERVHGICWRVPMPGHGTSFWIPIQINPEHERLWHRVVDQPTRSDKADPEVVDEDLDVGQVRLQRDGSRWVLHVTIDFEIDDRGDAEREAVTPVGFDVGISQLLVGCALENDAPRDPFIYSGGMLRHARQKQNSATQRLQERGSARLYQEVDAAYQNRIDDEIEQAITEAVEYAAGWENPIIVLEAIEGIREDVDSTRIHQWAFYRLQTRLEEKARERGIPVEYVPAAYTSQICHACQRVGHRPAQAAFRCPYTDCWVSEYQADINAAANTAHRLDPWGESLPVDKREGDDVPGSGASVTTPQDTSRREGHPSESRTPDDNAPTSAVSTGAGTEHMTLDADTS